MAQWIEVASESEFTGKVKIIEYQGKKIAVFHLESGYHAIDDRCSHAEASLGEGDVEGDEVECPLHGARFNICTGKNLSFPAVTPVNSYPVKVENGKIWLEVE